MKPPKFQSYKGSFAYLFWGLFLVILDVTFNRFDILVDGIGYLLIAAGCVGLVEFSKRFSNAASNSYVLAALWLIGFMVPRDLSYVYSLIFTIVDCFMIWQLLGGLADYASMYQRADLAKRAYSRRITYVVLIGISFIVSLNPTPFVAVILLLMMVFLLILILHLIHRIQSEIN